MFNNLETSLNDHAAAKLEYFQEWMFDSPLIISNDKFNETNKLHSAFYKLITYFVNNYAKYAHLMPLSADALKVLSCWQHKPFLPGTFRTDFVFDSENRFRPIEITCRFALNGFFINKVFELHAQCSKANIDEDDMHKPYDDFLPYISAKIQRKGRILLLKDSEDRNESKFFLPVFEQASLPIEVRTVSEINQKYDDLKDFFIINEFSINELLALDHEVHKALAESDILNDFRTIFLVHDKRFFSVICDETLQKNALNDEELSFFESVVIPTFGYTQSKNVWCRAKSDKNNWILKHRALGKSEAVFAGVVTSQSDWEMLFEREDIHEFVLQQWIEQSTVSGNIKENCYDDYITGTLLFYDQYNFGFADFRTSSFPVSNKVDHRKFASITLNKFAEQKYNKLKNIKVF